MCFFFPVFSSTRECFFSGEFGTPAPRTLPRALSLLVALGCTHAHRSANIKASLLVSVACALHLARSTVAFFYKSMGRVHVRKARPSARQMRQARACPALLRDRLSHMSLPSAATAARKPARHPASEESSASRSATFLCRWLGLLGGRLLLVVSPVKCPFFLFDFLGPCKHQACTFLHML